MNNFRLYLIFLFFSGHFFYLFGQDPTGGHDFDEDHRGDGFSLYGTVQSGDASFSTVGAEFQITASDGALINYYNFDIPAGETVRFIQPNSASSVVNKILGLVPTQIDGNLYGNGKVVLLNSSGIVFGENAVVEVGKLHAIAGTDTQESFSLSGTITNAGSIKAKEVVLAGQSVTNTGTILVEEGSLVMAAGASVGLTDKDNTLFVSISSEDPLGGASDIAGQAVLQSGVVQASKAQFYGNSITHGGSTQASTLTVQEYATFDGAKGTVSTPELVVSGSQYGSSTQNFDLSGKTNTVNKLMISGSHQDLKIRSSQGLQVGESVTKNEQTPNEDGGDILSVLVQNMDLRVDEGDLTLHVLPAPNLTTSDNSLLLAAENNLVLPVDLESFTHSRKILYGRNLGVGAIEKDDLALGSTVSLDAISIFIDDLSPTLSPSVIKALATDNPTFEGFDSKGGLVELSQMSEEQLNMLFKYGLFTGYSYFFQAPDKSAKLANDLEEAGGSSALFGGSFAVVASAGSASSDSSGDGGSEDGDGGSEDGDGDGSSSSTSSSANTAARAIGVAPFAPISRPILSVEASAILEKALAPEIEQKMEKYLNP